MAMKDRIPYVYVIGWQWLGLYYIGCQYRKGCHPDNLIVQYRTSSKRVHAILDKHGDPDIVWFETCNTVTQAKQLEGFLITISNAIYNPRYLNLGIFRNHLRCNTTDESVRKLQSELAKGRFHTPATRQKISEKHTGKKLSLEHRKRISEGLQGKTCGENAYWYNRSFTQEHRENLSKSRTGEKHWNFGNRGRNTPFYGKKHSHNTLMQMSVKRRRFHAQRRRCRITTDLF